MEEDFYDEEYEYFDNTIADLKEQLKKEVKQEIQDKIKTLEKENEELRDVKENWEKIKQEYRLKEQELKRREDRLEHDFRYAKFSELLKDFTTEVYGVSANWIKKDKCDACDSDRCLTLQDCYGRKHKVRCLCNDSYKKFVVKEKYLYISEISRYRNGANNLRMFIKERDKDSDYYGTSSIDKDVLFLEEFNLEKIQEKNYEKIYFYQQKEAQKYADYLNAKEA